MSHPNPVTKAVIPAAGLGTRFLPATKAMPKEMLPVVDKPAIQYVVAEARRAGLNDILMVTGRYKRALEDHFDRVPTWKPPCRGRATRTSCDASRRPPTSVTSITSARATRWAWATPCSVRATTWATNRSRSCSAMT